MSDNDENIKKAKQAADMVMMQNRIKDYQDRLVALQNKEYQGKFQGIVVKMRGDFQVIDVRIDQSFYETAGKGQIEKAILTLMTNLHNAIHVDQDDMNRELQEEVKRMQQTYTDGTN